MNQDPPEELAKIVQKNANITVRGRLQKLCDTILADSTGIQVIKIKVHSNEIQPKTRLVTFCF